MLGLSPGIKILILSTSGRSTFVLPTIDIAVYHRAATNVESVWICGKESGLAELINYATDRRLERATVNELCVAGMWLFRNACGT